MLGLGGCRTKLNRLVDRRLTPRHAFIAEVMHLTTSSFFVVAYQQPSRFLFQAPSTVQDGCRRQDKESRHQGG